MPAPAPRIAGPAPPDLTPITADEVRRWLRASERRAEIDTRTKSRLHPMHDVLRWPDTYIRDHQMRQYLKAWMYCAAHGLSFRGLCRDRPGWSERTGQREVAQAIEIITAMLNFERTAAGQGALVRDDGLSPAGC